MAGCPLGSWVCQTHTPASVIATSQGWGWRPGWYPEDTFGCHKKGRKDISEWHLVETGEAANHPVISPCLGSPEEGLSCQSQRTKKVRLSSSHVILESWFYQARQLFMWPRGSGVQSLPPLLTGYLRSLGYWNITEHTWTLAPSPNKLVRHGGCHTPNTNWVEVRMALTLAAWSPLTSSISSILLLVFHFPSSTPSKLLWLPSRSSFSLDQFGCSFPVGHNVAFVYTCLIGLGGPGRKPHMRGPAPQINAFTLEA